MESDDIEVRADIVMECEDENIGFSGVTANVWLVGYIDQKLIAFIRLGCFIDYVIFIAGVYLRLKAIRINQAAAVDNNIFAAVFAAETVPFINGSVDLSRFFVVPAIFNPESFGQVSLVTTKHGQKQSEDYQPCAMPIHICPPLAAS